MILRRIFHKLVKAAAVVAVAVLPSLVQAFIPPVSNYSAGLDLAIAKTGAVSVAKAQETPAYNAKGEPTADSRFRYVFNAFGWLTSVTNLVANPATCLSFAYDTGGRRVKKTVSERNGAAWAQKTVHQFYYDGWNLVAETITDKTVVPESTTLRLYTWGLDLAGQRGGRLGQSAGGIGGLLAITEIAGTVTNAYYPVSDHIGSIRGLVEASTGALVAEYEYDPYGVLLEEAGEKADVCPFRFSGKYYDPEMQLLYFGYRYYNPASTKWLTVDPLQERGGLNLTAYCGGDPVNQVDPLGLSFLSWLLGCGWNTDEAKAFDDYLHEDYWGGDFSRRGDGPAGLPSRIQGRLRAVDDAFDFIPSRTCTASTTSGLIALCRSGWENRPGFRVRNSTTLAVRRRDAGSRGRGRGN